MHVYGSFTKLQAPGIFDVEDANRMLVELDRSMAVCDFEGYVSVLGGPHRPTVMITVSLDPRSSWPSGILRNSAYSIFSIDADGVIQQLAHHKTPKFRKARAKSVADVVSKLNKWVGV